MDAFLWLNEIAPADNEFTTSNKTEEEIKKLTLDDDLGELKRSIHILTKGQPIQKYAVYANLHRILLENGAFDKFISIVQADVMNQNEENQIEASRSLLKLIASKELPHDRYLPLFRITLNVLTLWSVPVLDSWILVFHELLSRMPYEPIEKETTLNICYLSEPNQHVLSKYAAARMIGFVAEKQKSKFGGQLLDKALNLCQDIDVEVRKIVSLEMLQKVTFAVGKEYAEFKMLNKVIELVYDSDLQVKLASIDVLIEITDLLSEDCKKNRVVGTLIDFCTTNNEEIYRKMSFLIGKICHKLYHHITKEPIHLSAVQNFYKDTAYHKSLEVRKNFIHNIPAMIQLLDSKEQLRHMYSKMLKDPSKDLKIKSVGCFLEVCKLLLPVDMTKHFRDLYEWLIKEDDLEIFPKLVPQLAELTEIFQKIKNVENENLAKYAKDAKDKDKSSKENHQSGLLGHHQHNNNQNTLRDSRAYLDAIINIGNKLSANRMWRLEIILIDGFSRYYGIYNAKDIHERAVPYLIRRIKEGVNETRLKAIEMLVKFMRMNHMNSRSKDLLKALNEEFFACSCYKMRQAYINIFLKLAETFSRHFIKQNVLSSIFTLAADKTAQVRRRFVDILPNIRKTIFLEDSENLQRFNDIINQLMQDADKEVSEKATSYYKLSQEALSSSEDDEKRKQEEEELRARESKELEESKKRFSEEYASRFEHLQNYSSIIGGNNRKIIANIPKYVPVKTSAPPKVIKAGVPSITEGPPLKTPSLNSLGGGSLPRITSKSIPSDASPLTSSNKATGAGKAVSLNSLSDIESKARKKVSSIPVSAGLKEQKINPQDRNLENRDRVFRKLDDLPKIDPKNGKLKEPIRETATSALSSSNRNSNDRKSSLKIK